MSSSTIENKIVHLGFDNKQFEAGIAKSMNTLDKLKDKLSFKGATDGISKMQSAANGMDFSKLYSAVSSLNDRFSSIGIVGMNILNKLTDAAINAAKKVEQATIGQIKSGGWSRAMNLANAQFTVEGLKLDWDEMLKAINYGVQDTAYGLDAAAKAASTLAASGVKYKESVDGANDSLMHTSLRAISGVAAMTNSSYEDIAHVFTTVAGQGRLMGEQLNTLAARGMNAAATLGQALGHSEAEIREMVSKGVIDFETFSKAMDNAFGEHAKEANKTFTGSLSNMKAALSRIGAIFATPIVNKTNTLFIALTDRIKEFQKALSDTTDNEGNKIIRFAGHFAEAWEAGVKAISEIIEKLDLSWFNSIASKLDEMSIKAKTFFDDLYYLISDYDDKTKEAAESTGKTLSVTAAEAAAAKKVIAGMYGNGGTRRRKLEELYGKDSAKRIQDYVNSVAAAGWKYEKASIKVEDASETTEGSIAEVVKKQRELRKVKVHALLTQIHVGLSNIVRAGKNLMAAAGKIGKAIFTAFKNVFGFRDAIYDTTQGLSGFLIKIANFTKKLIISDDAAKKVTEHATAFFTVIKNILDKIVGLTKIIGNFIKKIVLARVEIAKLPQAAQDAMTKAGVGGRIFGIFQTLPSFVFKAIDTVKGIIGNLKNIKIPFLDKAESPLMKDLKSFGKFFLDTIKSLFTSTDISDAFTGLINGVLDMIASIDWKKAAKIFAMWYAVKTIWNTLMLIGSIGHAIIGLNSVISGIGTFFTTFNNALWRFGIAAKNLAIAGSIFIIAKSIALIAGVILVIAQIDDTNLYKAVGVMLIITLVMTKLGDFVNKLTIRAQSMGTMGAITSLTTVIRTLSALSVLMVAMGGAVLLISVGVAMVDRNGPDPMAMLQAIGIISALGLFTFAIIKMLSSMPRGAHGSIMGVTTILAISTVITAIGTAVLLVAAALSIMSEVPAGVFLAGWAIMATLMYGIYKILEVSVILAKYNPIVILAIAVAIVAVGVAISVIMLSISTAMAIMIGAVNVTNSGAEEFIGPIAMFVGMVATLVLAVIALVTVTDRLTTDMTTGGARLGVNLLAVSVVLIALASSIFIISAGLKMFASIDVNKMVPAFTLIILVVAGAVGLMRSVNEVPTDKMLKGAIMMLGIAVAMNLLVFAISRMAKMSTASVGMLIAIGVIAAVLYAISKFNGLNRTAENLRSAANTMGLIRGTLLMVVGGIIAFAVSVAILAAALSKLDNLDKIWDDVTAMILLIAAVAGVMALLAYFVGKNENSGDTLLNIGTTFIMVAAAMLILAVAIERLAAVSSGLGTVAIVFGAFLAIMLVFGVLAAKFPGFADGIKAVGSAFLSMGVGAALVGAGILLIVISIKLLRPYISDIAIDLDLIFKTLEQHWPVLIIVTVIIVAITVAVVALGLTVAPVIRLIATAVGNGIHMIIELLGTLTSHLKTFVSHLSTRGKTVLITLITTLCAAIIHSGPQILKTIGTLIFQTLEYLGSIIGDLAGALLGFLINLINALADAIRSHSNQIVAAIFNLIYALIDVILAVLKEIVNILVGGISPKVAEAITGFFDYGAEELDKHANRIVEQAKAADEAKLANARLADSINDAANATERCNTALSGSGNSGFLSSTSEGASGAKNKLAELRDELSLDIAAGEGMKETFHDLPQAAQDAMTKAGVGVRNSEGMFTGYTKSSEKAGEDSGLGFVTAFGGSLDGASIPGMDNPEDLMNQAGMGTDAFGATGLESGEMFTENAEDGITDPNGYYGAEEDNMDGTIQAVKDKKKEHADTVGEYINDPGIARVRAAEPRYRSAMDYCVAGIVSAAQKGEDPVRKAMMNLANQGLSAFVGPQGLDENSPSKKTFNAGVYAVLGFINAIAKKKRETRRSMQDLAATAVDSFGNPLQEMQNVEQLQMTCDIDTNVNARFPSMYDEGYDAMSLGIAGMVSAANSGQIILGDAMTNLAVFGVQSFTGPEGLDENSPSKKFYQAGVYATLGFINGIRKNEETVGATMNGLSSTVIDSFGNPMQYVASMANGDIQYDPSIRPVLDTSGIARGAYGIDSMFQNQNVTLSGLSGQIAADIGQLDSRNSDVVEELKALREEMSYLSDDIQQMQVVMDTGALVGTMAGPMDKAMGRRAIYRGRGN